MERVLSSHACQLDIFSKLCFCTMQAALQDMSGRPRFRPAKQDIWYGMHALIRLTHAGALTALLQKMPTMLEAIFEEATSAELKSFTAIECLHEVLANLGPQVNVWNMYEVNIQEAQYRCSMPHAIILMEWRKALCFV